MSHDRLEPRTSCCVTSLVVVPFYFLDCGPTLVKIQTKSKCGPTLVKIQSKSKKTKYTLTSLIHVILPELNWMLSVYWVVRQSSIGIHFPFSLLVSLHIYCSLHLLPQAIFRFNCPRVSVQLSFLSCVLPFIPCFPSLPQAVDIELVFKQARRNIILQSLCQRKNRLQHQSSSFPCFIKTVLMTKIPLTKPIPFSWTINIQTGKSSPQWLSCNNSHTQSAVAACDLSPNQWKEDNSHIITISPIFSIKFSWFPSPHNAEDIHYKWVFFEEQNTKLHVLTLQNNCSFPVSPLYFISK